MSKRSGLCMIGATPNKFTYFLIAGMFLGISFLLLFLDLAEAMLDSGLGLFDQTVTAAIAQFRSPLATEIMKLITAMGSAAIMIVLAGITVWYLLAVKKHFWDATVLIMALSGAAFIDWVLKLGFHRSRPNGPSLAQAAGYSFPSGHAMISLAFYGMLAYLLWLNFKPVIGTYLIIFFIALLIVAIGISRIYLGVHYPSDVLAGYAAGGFWLSGCILGLHTGRHLKNSDDLFG